MLFRTMCSSCINDFNDFPMFFLYLSLQELLGAVVTLSLRVGGLAQVATGGDLWEVGGWISPRSPR